MNMEKLFDIEVVFVKYLSGHLFLLDTMIKTFSSS